MKKKPDLGFVIVLILAIAFGFYFFIETKKVDKLGVYVIGAKFKSTPSAATSGSSYYYYNYKDKRYEWNIADAGSYSDSLIFLKILPNNPEICRPDFDFKVPKCLTINDSPSEGWKTIPKCDK